MQLPIIAHRGQKKPYGSIPRINWLHPLTKGLVSYGYDAGMGPIDLVSGRLPTIDNSARITGIRPSAYGSGILYLNSAPVVSVDAISLPTSNDVRTLTNTSPYSFACSLMITTAPPSKAVIFSTHDGTLNAFQATTAPTVAITDFSFQFADGSDLITASGLATLNAFHTMVGVALTDTTVACYVDGNLAISTTIVTTLLAGAAGTKPAFSGNFSTSRAFIGGYIYYGALWKARALTASEARLLHDDPYCFLIYPEDEMFASLIGTTRCLHPDADSIDGSWTNELNGAVLFSSIDEISVSDDTDYIQSSNNPSSDLCKISLSDPSIARLGSPVKVRYRYKKKDSSPTAADLTVRLLQGVTQITSWSHTGISTSYVTTEQTLSAPELASITDFTDLYLEFTANS